jgi:hypothetical protein
MVLVQRGRGGVSTNPAACCRLSLGLQPAGRGSAQKGLLEFGRERQRIGTAGGAGSAVRGAGMMQEEVHFGGSAWDVSVICRQAQRCWQRQPGQDSPRSLPGRRPPIAVGPRHAATHATLERGTARGPCGRVVCALATAGAQGSRPSGGTHSGQWAAAAAAGGGPRGPQVLAWPQPRSRRARPVQTFYFDHHFHRCREGVQVTRGMMQQELQAWVQVWPSSRGAAKPWAAAGLVPAGAAARRNTGAQTPTPSVPGRPPPPPGWVRRRQQPQGGCSGPRHAVAQAVDAWCSPQGDDCRLVVAAMLIRSAPARYRLLRIPAAPSCAPAGQQFETGKGGF